MPAPLGGSCPQPRRRLRPGVFSDLEFGPWRKEALYERQGFELEGQEFVALNGGPHFTFNEAISFQVSCETQQEVDAFWSKLTDGREESMCAG